MRRAEQPLVARRRARGALLERGEDRAAVVVDDHDRQVRARLVGPEHQAGGVVQERHVAHQGERRGCCAAGRARRRSRSRRCRRCRPGPGWRAPSGARRRRSAAPSGRGRGPGSRRRRRAGRRAGRARLTAPATWYGVRPACVGQHASSRAGPSASAACHRRARPGRRARRRRRRRTTGSTAYGPVRPAPRGRRPRHLDVVAAEQPAAPGATASGGRRPPPARSGRPSSVVEQQPVGAHRVGPGARPAGRLGEQRPAGCSASDRGRAGPRRRRRPRPCAGRGAELAVGARGHRDGRADVARRSTRPGRDRRRQRSGRAPAGRRAGTLRCTGPPGAERGDRSVAVADVGRRRRSRPRPKMPTWSVVWLAPVPRSRAGRSAVTTTSGDAGVGGLEHRRVQVGDGGAGGADHRGRATPTLVSPSARNPAVRSSMRVCSRSSPAAAAS